MYRKCSSEKSALQQRKFESCMLDAMSQQSYDAISVSALCRQAGMSRKTFYRLFDTKSDVIYALIDHTIMDAAFYTPSEADGPGEMHRFFGYWRSQKRFLDVLEQNNISNLLTQRCIQHILREAPEIQRAFGTESSDMGRETMIFYLSGLFAMVLDWHHHNFSRSIDEMAALVMHLLSEPAIKNDDKAYWDHRH